MKSILAIIFPPVIGNRLRGVQWPLYVFSIYALFSTIRSCIHLLAPDGGAGSIAGFDLSVAGAEGIIFAFGLWGSSQLLFALIQLLVVVRYRSLIPLMVGMLILEVLLRELVGIIKPVALAHSPPGAIANHVILPVAVLMLLFSLGSASRESPNQGNSPG